MAEPIDRYRSVLDTLAGGGWTVRERAAGSVLTPADVWPAALRERYPTIPTALTDFVARVEECVEPGQQMWFLSAGDYAGTTGPEWPWNAMERMELETVEGDVEELTAIRSFWDDYLPFFFDVSSDYAYFAVRITEPKPGTWDWLPRSLRPLAEPRAGAIVHAVEELRSVSQVAGSFSEFLDHLANAVKHPQRDGPLSGMV